MVAAAYVATRKADIPSHQGQDRHRRRTLLAVGSYFAVQAMQNTVKVFGISRIVSGLFTTTPVAALPEVFAIWKVVRSGQIASDETSVMGDHAVTLTVALLPLALIGMPISNLSLFSVNLSFVALMLALYAAFIHFHGGHKYGFRRWHVFAFAGAYLFYILLIVFWVQPFRSN